MLGIGDYLWRLVPANPILLRVVTAGGKRRRDLFIRCGYLGLLVLVVVLSLLPELGSATSGGLAGLAKMSASLFQHMSYLQLALVALLAPIFTAGAITQEKDSQTYDILLSTPLTNGQIVLGSLLSRLFFVVALLVSGIPVFSITQIFGGVAIISIVLSFLIAAATAFVAGALAMAIATFKVGTRRTIFSFYLLVIVYLVGLALLDQLTFFHPVIGQQTVAGQAAPIYAKTSYLTGLHPFLALRVIFHEDAYTPPPLGALPPELQRWPLGTYLSSPHLFYIEFMFILSLLLVLPSIALLRRVAQSTVSIQNWILQKLHLKRGDQTRKPRYVWHNPIAWREAKTKASAARASALRYGFMVGGVVGSLVLVWMFASTKEVAQYVTSQSYDASHDSITITYTKENRADTLLTGWNTTVTLNGTPISIGSLRGKYQVERYTVEPRNKQVLTSLSLMSVARRVSADDARRFLLGGVIVEFAVILLIVTNAAASTVTREKEDGSLDLLLTTPITSRYYIWGKLSGLVGFVLPLIAVPVLSALVFIVYDIARQFGTNDPSFTWIVFPEAVLIMPGTLIIVAAFAGIVGMHMSLRCRRTVMAVMSSIGIVVGLCAALGWCGYAFLGTRGANEFNLIVGSFSPFTVLTVLIDPYSYGGTVFKSSAGLQDSTTGRSILFFFSWAATAAYAVVVWMMYRSMVTNFDMTIRRQSR